MSGIISKSDSYAAAGVDITAGYKAVELMKKHIARTTEGMNLETIGGFGGTFPLRLAGINNPVLVSGTDGVGTKLRIAMLMDKHNTIGIDCVAMSVNDVICCGARPLFFLDYIACGKNIPEKIASIVEGVAEGCVQAGCALIGGETAEHPGMMAEDDYDLAGFAVGIADADKLINNASMKEGDCIIALPSTGPHSNGFSLIRRALDVENRNLHEKLECLGGQSIGEALLTPTKIYVKAALAAIDAAHVSGISHITGGGFYENIPRAVPQGLCAVIEKKAVRTPAIFDLIAAEGKIPERDMFNTFNMGVGMSIIVRGKDADAALEAIRKNGVDAYVIGEIVKGEEQIRLA